MSNKKNKREKALRYIAVFLAVNILSEVIFPTAAMALTSGPTQPEFNGYQPVDATDNVSLVSGRFNYTIPITSIPEFPMAMGYNAGLGMEQEASCFGYGFNGFSGAITRNMAGLPDDVRNAEIKYLFQNQKRTDMSATVMLSGGFGPLGVNVSLTGGRDNYTGVYGALGMGLGLSTKVPGIDSKWFSAGGGIGASLISDSRNNGLSYGIGAGLGISSKKLHLQEQVAGIGLGGTIDKKGSKMSKGGFVIGSAGKSMFGVENKASTSTLASLAYIMPNSTGFGASVTVPFGSFSFTGNYNQWKMGDGEISKSAFGYQYLGGQGAATYDISNRDNIADMTIEGEDSYNDDARNNPSYLQYDNFNLNTMGLGGSMRLFQTDYGMVARNYNRKQHRDFSLTGFKTHRQETYPWYSVRKAKVNKSIDIIALLKKKDDPESKDFDNVLFDEQELVNFNTGDRQFNETQFKMRGDMAGEFDASSSGYSDFDPNAQSLTYVNGTDDQHYMFMGYENGVPQYYPNISNPDRQDLQKPAKIERSTIIKKRRIADMLTDFSSANDLATNNPFKFNQSIFSQYNYKRPGTDDIDDSITMNCHLENMNLLGHLQDLQNLVSTNDPDNNHPYFGSLIGSIEVQNASGLKYYFGLPVFAKNTTSLQLKGNGITAPTLSGNDYTSFADGTNRGKVKTTENFMYPCAWLLTAIVGDDYIDFDDIPGPSDGDIGYWVKFKYTKTSDNFTWRTPYAGMNHIAVRYHDYGDDAYFASSGNKEQYYLTEIESSNYQCKYTYQKRFDAVSAKQLGVGDAKNLLFQTDVTYSPGYLGTQSLFAVAQIDLFKKHNSGNKSEEFSITGQKPIKSTKFYYDYTTCENIPNNLKTCSYSINIGQVAYHKGFGEDDVDQNTPIKKGKLTLVKVQHIAYDEDGNATKLPSYQFNYWKDEDNTKYNPDYNKNMNDQWGNYMSSAKDHHRRYALNGTSDPISGDTWADYYTNYTEYIKSKADDNARVYNLKSIDLPSGGSMEVDYQPQSYGYVEDQTPYVMRHVFEVSPGANPGQSVLKVDVTDLYEDGVDLSTARTTNAAGESRPIISINDETYGELAFYKWNKSSTNVDPGHIYVSSGKVKVEAISSSPVPYSYTVNSATETRYYQEITVSSVSNGGFDASQRPFVDAAINYMLFESEEGRALKEQVNPFSNCNNVDDIIANYENAELSTPLEAAKKVIANIKNSVQTVLDNSTHLNSFSSNFTTCYGAPGTTIYPHLSYFRTNIYKAKYTGCAVKSIKLNDNFKYATKPDGSGPEEQDNTYGTYYFFDMAENGKGTSSGVTPIEPGGGESCVIDILKVKGAGFAPGPNIVYSKATVENIYTDEQTSSSVNGDIVARNKGKTVYEFYTAKDPGYQFADHFRTTQVLNAPGPANGSFNLAGMFTFFVIKLKLFHHIIKIKIPMFVPVIIHWARKDSYYLKSYSFTDYADIFGRPKSIRQKDKEGTVLGEQKFTYFGVNEQVNVCSTANNFTTSTTNKKPGRMDQSWTESYYTKETDLFYLVLFINANTQRKFSHTNMKYTYIPPLMKKVESNFDGLATTTENTLFDYYTGTPLEVKSNDSYNNTKIVRTVPAYWKYQELGSAETPIQANHPWQNSSTGFVNNFSSTTGTYMYLNTVDASHVLAAGVVTWEKRGNGQLAPTAAGWHLTPYMVSILNSVDATTNKYTYLPLPGTYLESRYMSPATDAHRPIARNAYLFKPQYGFTYDTKTALDADGTFSNLVAFTYTTTASTVNANTSNSSSGSWKLISSNNLYSTNGVLLESKDVLGKYVAQLLGYSFSNTMGAVSNSSWGGSVHEGAENNYISTGSAALLEADRVRLWDAKVVEACEKKDPPTTICASTFPVVSSHKVAKVLTVTLPASVNYHVPFAQFNVQYLGSSGQTISKSLFISVSDDNSFEIITNTGEAFNGFFVLPQGGNVYKLIFDPNVITSAAIQSSFTADGYTVSYNSSETLPDCDFGCRTYILPETNCPSEVHTGSFAFQLDPGKKGTAYVIHKEYGPSPTPEAESHRKYKALVWVHASSPLQTQLVAEVKTLNTSTVANYGATALQAAAVSTTYSTSAATPYVTAGNWKLLRLDFDLTTNTTNKVVVVYVKNGSTGGVSVYDDLRILPYHAEMTNWVFDQKFNRVVSGLDKDNFASYSEYDSRGRATQSSIELQNDGKKLIQKFMYNDQKKN